MPAYPRSEEFYQGGQFQPYMPDNSDTLQLMREAKTRNLQQKGQIGDLTAESIREPAKQWSDTIKALPGAAGEGMGMRQSYDRRSEEAARHQMGAEEHQAQMGTIGQQREMNAQTMEANRLKMQDEQRKREFLSKPRTKPAPGVAEEAYTPEQQMWLNDVEQGKLGLEQTRTGIAANKAQIAQAAEAKRQQDITDQATIRAYYQSKGLNPPPVGSREFNNALADAKAAGIIKSAESSEGLIYDQSVEGQRVQQKLQGIDAKLQALTQAKSAAAKYKAAAPYSKASKDAKIELAKAMEALGKDINDVEGRTFLGVGADLGGVDTAANRFNAAAEEAKQEAKRELEILKSRSASASPKVKRDIANLERTIANIDLFAGVEPNLFGNRGYGSGAPPIRSDLPQNASFKQGSIPENNPTSTYRRYAK